MPARVTLRLFRDARILYIPEKSAARAIPGSACRHGMKAMYDPTT
jgi:hypothetical protein